MDFTWIEDNNVEAIQLYCNKGHSVHVQNEDDEYAFTFAVEQGAFDVAFFLLEKGAEIDHENMNGETPLYLAAKQGNTDLVLLLLEKGVDVNAKNEFGETALSIASSKGHLEIVKALLSHGAEINVRETLANDCTPLINAVYNKHYEVAKYLLGEGASGSIRTKNNMSAIEYMLQITSYNEEETLACKEQFLDLFIRHKYQFDESDQNYINQIRLGRLFK